MPRQFYGSWHTKVPWRTRFWAKVQKTETCWVWTCAYKSGRRSHEKRAMFKDSGRWWGAARFIWTKSRGPIPKGMQVLHTCDNPMCVRLSHLWLGTQIQNIEDMRRKGRARGPDRRGEEVPNAKLSELEARDIKELRRLGIPIREIQKHYPMSQAQISRIANGKRWAHLHSRR